MDESRILIGVVTAIPVEWAALQLMLDDPEPIEVDGDSGRYLTGTMPSRVAGRPHRIVAVRQVIDGNRSAAAVSTRLATSFPGLRDLVMCGIAGGIPTAGHDVKLGDVVSATHGVIDYDHVRSEAAGDRIRRSLEGLSKRFLGADGNLDADERLGRSTWHQALARPGVPPQFRHPAAATAPPTVHRGAIGSADRLLNHLALRDRLAREHGMIAVEMEGSGIAVGSDLSGLHWYVVRGISDLADGSKNDVFQPYAALVAAAYVRALLGELDPPAGASVDGGGFNTIVTTLTALLTDEQNRRSVLDRLPDRIRTQVPSRDTARVQAVTLASTCERFPGGGRSLLEAVSAVAGTDPDFADFAEAMRRHWRGR